MSPKQNLPWHPSFKLNGLSFETLADFEEFLNSIDQFGDDHERDLAEFLISMAQSRIEYRFLYFWDYRNSEKVLFEQR